MQQDSLYVYMMEAVLTAQAEKEALDIRRSQSQ